MLSILILTLLGFNVVSFTRAGIYVTQPEAGSTCHAGQDCAIEWVDDGQSPLLAEMGQSTVGLYTGNQVLVQPIGTLDVSNTLTVNFTPNAELGPDDGGYYISFISTTAMDDQGVPFAAFSPFFSLHGMTGTIDPNRSTGTFPSVSNAAPAPISTFTVGSSFTLTTTGFGTTVTSAATRSGLATIRNGTSGGFPTASNTSSSALSTATGRTNSGAVGKLGGAASLGVTLLAVVVALAL